MQILKDELDIVEDDKSLILYNKKGVVLKIDKNIDEVYQEDKDDDGFLYLDYSDMKSFG